MDPYGGEAALGGDDMLDLGEGDSSVAAPPPPPPPPFGGENEDGAGGSGGDEEGGDSDEADGGVPFFGNIGYGENRGDACGGVRREGGCAPSDDDDACFMRGLGGEGGRGGRPPGDADGNVVADDVAAAAAAAAR